MKCLPKKAALGAGIIFLLLSTATIKTKGQSSGLIPVPDHGAIQSLGNGKMCIYEKGPDIVTAYTGPYSSPSFLMMEWLKGQGGISQASRKPGTAIWTHKILAGNSETGALLDFVDAGIPCFVRQVNTQNRITFRVKLEKYVQVIDNTGRLILKKAVNGRLLVVPSGTTIYQTYVYP